MSFENIGEKEKMLATSIFLFSYNVFHPSQKQIQSFELPFAKALNLH